VVLSRAPISARQWVSLRPWRNWLDAQGAKQPLAFGEVAELYEQYRPGYREVVFDRVVEFGELRPGDPALEVGCGTGRATLPLAARGLLVTALELSPEMARVARQKTRELVGVRVEEASFEDWALPREPLRLVTSAQAWHWGGPRSGSSRPARRSATGTAWPFSGTAPSTKDIPIQGWKKRSMTYTGARCRTWRRESPERLT
jgi:SAM-dependent methyltransferase